MMSTPLIACIFVIAESAILSGPCKSASEPLIIAHRGGQMGLPGSSIASYRRTLATEAADFLECDLTITKDGVLLCQHEPDLSKSTNADAAEFRQFFDENSRSKEQLDSVLDFRWGVNGEYESYGRPDCRPRNTWYTADYNWNGTMDRLSSPCLSHQTCSVEVPPVHQPLATLKDLWAMVTEHAEKRTAELAANSSKVPREIGLYLEIKHSTWHQSRRDRDLVSILLSFLSRRSKSNGNGYDTGFPIYLQSFEIMDLIRFRQQIGFDSPNIKLVGLSSSLRTIYNLPYDCCTETEASKTYLTKMKPIRTAINGSGLNGDEDVAFLRQEGSFGEMFLGVARLLKSKSTVLDLDVKCKNRRSGQRSLEQRFLATTKVGPDQFCGEGCTELNVGLKMVPLGLSRAESFVTADTSIGMKRRICQQELERISESQFITCTTPKFKSAHVLDSLASTTELFDISCFVDVLGIHLDMIRKHPEIVQEAHDKCMPLHVWTVKHPEDLQLALLLKVDGLITDDATGATRYLLNQ